MASSNVSMVNKENNSVSQTLGATVDSFTINTEWNGELVLEGQLVSNTSPLVPGAFMETNILAYLNPMYKKFKLAFDPIKYPVGDAKIHNNNQGWSNLKRVINDAARSAGYKVASNTQGTIKQTSVALLCQRGQKHNESKSVHKGRTQDDYRKSTYTGDRKNNREEGKRKPQRTGTALAPSQEHRCPFRFNIGVDQSSFFLKCGTGCIIHKSHPQLLPKQIGQSVRNATEEERQQLARHKAACTIPSVSRNIHFQDTGRFYTRAQIRYAQSMQEKCTKMLVDSGMGPTDHFMDILLKKEGVNSMFLLGEEGDYQLETAGIQRRAAKKQAKLKKEAAKKQAKADEKLQNQVHFSKDNPLGNPESTHLEDFQPGGQEQAEAEKYAADKRSDLNLKGSQASMIACAWTVNSEVRLFQQFHLVICIDGLQDTNKECRPEITVSIKDTEGKWHVVLRALPPNERAWVFRWIFQSVIPTLLGKHVLAHAQVIITDGDSQETSQLDNALKIVFPTALRVRCMWHIVDRGLYHRKPGRPPQDATALQEKQCKQLRSQVHQWLFTFAKDPCETEEQYQISKALLQAFLRSDLVVNVVGQKGSEAYLQFLRGHVFVHEELHCFYRRIGRAHCDICANSGHEGTNNGNRKCATATGPQQPLPTSVQNQITYSDMKDREHSVKVAALATKQKLWTDLPVANHITNKAVCEILNQDKICHGFCSIQYNGSHWRVRYWRDLRAYANLKREGFHPVYDCVRIVTLEDGVLKCTCKRYQRFCGLPCRHQLHVMFYYQEAYEGLGRDDIGVTWWSTYLLYFASQEQQHKELNVAFKERLQAHSCGPSFNQSQQEVTYPLIRKGRNVPQDVPIEEGFFTIKPMKESCINYTKDEIEAALLAASADDKEVPPNMSQLSQVDSALPNFDKELFQEKVLSASGGSGQTKSSAYSQAIQAFKEHCNKFLEGHPERIGTFLQDIATRASQHTKEERPSGVKHPKGRVVSSELESSKKRKAHGNKY